MLVAVSLGGLGRVFKTTSWGKVCHQLLAIRTLCLYLPVQEQFVSKRQLQGSKDGREVCLAVLLVGFPAYQEQLVGHPVEKDAGLDVPVASSSRALLMVLRSFNSFQFTHRRTSQQTVFQWPNPIQGPVA